MHIKEQRAGHRIGLGLAVVAVVALSAWLVLVMRQRPGGAGLEGVAAAPHGEPAPAAAPALTPPPAEARRRVVPDLDPAREETPAAPPATRAPGPPGGAWWPELVLAVRDAGTRAELADLELRALPSSYGRASWAQPGEGPPTTSLGAGLRSPIALRAGRAELDGSVFVHGISMHPAEGAAVEYARLDSMVPPDRGVVLWARTPTHAWGRIQLDLASAGERELLLGPGAELEVQLAGVALDAYAELELDAALYLERPDRPWGEREVWTQRLDATAAEEGVHLEGLPPDAYRLSVELGAPSSWRSRQVLASEELTLAAGERRTVLLTLAEPPRARERAPLEGTLSLPSFPGEDAVVLRLYDAATYSQGPADVELPLAEMRRVGGALPTWSWRVDALPEGTWQAKVWPFLQSWMIEQPAAGRSDVELALPELAELIVETVDGASGERVPLEHLRYGYHEWLEGQVNHLSEEAPLDGEPGRFRIWTAPGTLRLSTAHLPAELDYGDHFEQIEVVAGRQERRFTLERVCAIRFEFRDGDATLPRSDAIFRQLVEGVSAVGHDGRVTHIKLATERILELSRPGRYEISFEGVGAGRFLPIPPREVDVRPGELSEVVVELRRE